ncbi:MAG TPA: hypothetical protein V6D22_08100 [Candidatus Obscuribacterales bacterium]
MAESELSDIHNVPNSESGATAQPQPSPEDESFPPRRGGFRNVFSALKYVNDASATESVKQRISDYVTIGLVVMCIFSLVAAVALPGVSFGLKLLPLVFTIGAVVFYIINRLGIIVSLNSRQALIVWQILIAAFWLGVTSAMFVMMSCFYFFGVRTQM